MNKIENLVSLPLERNVLAGLLKFPEIWPEVDVFLTDEDFYNKNHKTIFCVIRASFTKAEKLDRVVLATKIQQIGLGYFEDIPMHEYIDTLYYCQINRSGTLQSVKELIKLRICREVLNQNKRVEEFVLNNLNKETKDILSQVDVLNNEKINNLYSNDCKNEPVDLVEGLEAYIEGIGNSAKDNEITAPYKHYNELFGGFTPGSLTFFVARAKSNKSTFLLDIAVKTVLTQDVKVLMLDTELDTDLVRRRLISSFSGVNEYFIRTNLWRKNKEMVDKVRSAIQKTTTILNKIKHIYVGGTDIDTLLSMARRWYYKEVGRNTSTKAMIILDYVKLSDELITTSQYSRLKDYQLIGLKTDKLKRLSAELPKTAILTAGQTNRLNEGKERQNSGISVAGSDQINGLSSAVFLVNKVSMDEIAQIKGDYSIDLSHILIPLYCRSLGPLGDFQENVRIQRGKDIHYMKNQLFFKIDSFNVQEINSLYNLEQMRKDKINVQGGDDTKNMLD